ncbi:glycosyltransferase family 4 protein [Salegentibacter flavus]|uniref:Glycosyltransferase involved in cell wall bisynthesis n=1 Tax=Salegentibacter flavus TaxID=287099 RepID=A0A1I4Y5C5_9FLAO|nr:glycosyltransferase family 4 protein [Salegentibacter flavus]SFN33217.1 Glycosyltransferase involved in cell wall bisynthesis [Salegentibacter flavus]
MLSIFAPHFFNWTEQLKDSGHEVYWLDIFDSNTKVEQIDFAKQIIGWRYRWDHPGRYFLKKKASGITRLINNFNERKFQQQLEKQIKRIEPDVVHSFVMYLGGVPALPVMEKFPGIKWAYTAWGSDMYYYRKQPEHLEGMKRTLPHMDYMFADCQRDHNIAKEHGFKGRFLGVYPGGGGFDFESLDPFMRDQENRNIILVKGYQGLHGKCISVLKAILELGVELNSYRIVVFGAAPEVFKFVETSALKEFKNLEVYGKLTYQNLMEMMGQSCIYIGNSSSDGMPNTLLEAIIMEVFPIQSNPGGATAEIIEHKKNGLLIVDPENSRAIAELLKEAIDNPESRKNAINWNSERIKPNLERKRVRKRVLEAYQKIEEDL